MPPKKNKPKWKPTRGGGHKFTNPRRLASAGNDEEEGMWGVSYINEFVFGKAQET